MDIQGAYVNYMFDLAEQELIRKSIDMKGKNVFEYYPFFRLSQAWQISTNVGEYEFCEAGGKPDNTCLQLCDFDKSGAIVCDVEGTPFDIKLNGAGKLVNVSNGGVLLPINMASDQRFTSLKKIKKEGHSRPSLYNFS